MVVKNIDTKIMSHIHEISYSDIDHTSGINNICGYLDAMIDFGFINEMEYDNYMNIARVGF